MKRKWRKPWSPETQEVMFHLRSISCSPVWMWDHKEGWVTKNWCFQIVVLQKTLENPLGSKEIKPVHWKDWCWSWSSNTLVTWCKEPTHWKRPWYWERLRAGEGGDRGWDGWMISLTQWTWIWAVSGRWLKTGKPGMLQSMGLQRLGYDWAIEKQATHHQIWTKDFSISDTDSCLPDHCGEPG